MSESIQRVSYEIIIKKNNNNITCESDDVTFCTTEYSIDGLLIESHQLIVKHNWKSGTATDPRKNDVNKWEFNWRKKKQGGKERKRKKERKIQNDQNHNGFFAKRENQKTIKNAQHVMNKLENVHEMNHGQATKSKFSKEIFHQNGIFGRVKKNRE